MSCEEKQAALSKKLEALMGEMKNELETLAQNTKDKAKEIDPDVDTNGLDVWIGADIDIQWERTEFVMDLPEVTMKEQTWSLDLPQVTVRDQEIIFHTPSTRTERVKTGEYPEFYCEGGFPPKCTVRWSPMWADLPVPFMQEQRIVMGVPEFRMDRTSFVWSLPEFRMTTQRLALHLPQITIKNISVEAEKAKKKGEELSAQTTQATQSIKATYKERAKMEHGWEAAALFECYQIEILKSRDAGLAQFATGIAMAEAAIASMAANKVPADNENFLKMSAQLSATLKARDDFLNQMQQNIDRMSKSQADFVDSIFK